MQGNLPKSELLTIVIPTRDRADLLEMCLRSVFEKQTVRPRVIVSDNSTNEIAKMSHLRSRYSFEYVRRSGRLSMTDHHNSCLSLARTRWALLLHDDDELYPYTLEKFDMFLVNCANVGLVVGGFQRIDELSIGRAVWLPQTAETLTGEDALLHIGLNFQAHPPSTVYNVAAFARVGGFPDALGAAADYPLILRLAYSYGVAFFPDVLGRYRVGPQQGTDFSLRGAERTLDCTIRMSNLTRGIGCSEAITEQLIDYNTWWIFRIIASNLFSSHPFFVGRLLRKCMLVTPMNGHWKSRVKQEYPMLFFRPWWLSLLVYQLTRIFLPAGLRRRLGCCYRSWLRGSANQALKNPAKHASH